MSIFIIAEIGINHNGDLKIAKKLIDLAKDAGADAVKFQKRTIDLVYEREMLESYSQHDSERIRNAVEQSLYQIRGFWLTKVSLHEYLVTLAFLEKAV